MTTRQVASRLAMKVVEVISFSADFAKQFHLKKSHRHAVSVLQANGIDSHIVFSSAQKKYVDIEAAKLRALFVDFAEETMHRTIDGFANGRMWTEEYRAKALKKMYPAAYKRRKVSRRK